MRRATESISCDEAGVMTERTDSPHELMPRPGDALCIVDLQRDFLPGGPLAVRDADTLVPVVNRLVELFTRRSLPVIASRDWHPPDHCSFAENGGEWPVHCVADTPGADFAEGLRLPDDALIISKGTTKERDAYSAFERTGLVSQLRKIHIRRVFVCGVATDVCVQATARDALANDFNVMLLTDAVRGVDRTSGDSERAICDLQQSGARLADSVDVLRSAEGR
jgi:nicotinamidase-related amidase